MSESIPDKQIVVRFPNHVLPASLRENMGKGATVDNMDPSCPFLVLEKYDRKKSYEWLNLRAAWVAKSMPNDIIIPDPTPEVKPSQLNKRLLRMLQRKRRLPVEAQSLSTAADDKSLRLHGGQLRNYSSTSMSNESLNSATNRFPSIKKVPYCCIRCAQEGAKACMNKKVCVRYLSSCLKFMNMWK
uniref:Uncharacterized protein n=1 Tax=Oryza rufipogon TaxID=4529 RepID=A0A0E0NCL4_ORYRU